MIKGIANLNRRRFLLLTGAAVLPIAISTLVPAAWAAVEGEITVYRDPSCGCCMSWVDHLRKAGFRPQVIEEPEINRIKTRLGVPKNLWACHTAEFGGYIIEGHVPAVALSRLITQRPAVKGLAVPGMPAGSPGMEGGTAAEPFEVRAFGPDGERTFMRFKGARILPNDIINKR